MVGRTARPCPVCSTPVELAPAHQDPRLAALCATCRRVAGDGDPEALLRLAAIMARQGSLMAAGWWLAVASYLAPPSSPLRQEEPW